MKLAANKYVKCLLLIALCAILVILHDFHRDFHVIGSAKKRTKNKVHVHYEAFSNLNYDEILVSDESNWRLSTSNNDNAASGVADGERITPQDEVLGGAPSTTPNTKMQLDKVLKQPANIPIYLSDQYGSQLSAMDWNLVASIWDRDTTYDHLLQQAQTIPYSYFNTTTVTAKEKLQQLLQGNNVTIVFHTSPKTASSTMRNACIETQVKTCNNTIRRGGKWPDGYRTPKRLAQLFEICPNTYHFCAKEYIPITLNYTKFYNTRTFLHLFPFRNYDEWTTSALQQLRFRDIRDHGTECYETIRLLEECKAHKYELDFEKYTKSIVASVLKSYKFVQTRVGKDEMKMTSIQQHHTFLLYNYLYLHETLEWLSSPEFGVTHLHGLDRKINSERPDETCKEEEWMLDMFHDCFSDQLAGIH